MQQHSLQFIRRRRFLLVLPLLTIPFITGLLWALDDKGRDEKRKEIQQDRHGLNPELPGAHLKDDRTSDKMDFYSDAQMDSVKRMEKERSQAFYGRRLDGTTVGSVSKDSLVSEPDGKASAEERISSKLRTLDAVMHSTPERVRWAEEGPQHYPEGRPVDGAGMERLEKMMQRVKEEKEDDADMRQMNQVLDKLLRVQHPNLVKDSVWESLDKTKALPVEKRLDEGSVSLLQNMSISTGTMHEAVNQFYGLSDTMTSDLAGNALQALVPESQTLVNGGTVKLQLVQEVAISGIVIPAGSAIYGVASLRDERLNVGIRAIRYGNYLLPVDLHVYDEDGLEGIYIPGGIGRDVMKQSAGQELNSLGLGTYDPSAAGQAASAGIQVARNIISRKVKLVRVKVEAGYRVWLKDAKRD